MPSPASDGASIGAPELVGGPDEATRPRPHCPGAAARTGRHQPELWRRSPWRRMFGQGRWRASSEACPSRSSAARRSRWSASRAAASRRSRARSAACSRRPHGQIRFAGRPLPDTVRARSDEVRRRIQYIFQNPDASLNPRRTVGRHRRSAARDVFPDAPAPSAGSGSRRCLQDVRLDAELRRALPGPALRRRAPARRHRPRPGLATPDLLLCDEILSALDVSVQASILALLGACAPSTTWPCCSSRTTLPSYGHRGSRRRALPRRAVRGRRRGCRVRAAIPPLYARAAPGDAWAEARWQGREARSPSRHGSRGRRLRLRPPLRLEAWRDLRPGGAAVARCRSGSRHPLPSRPQRSARSSSLAIGRGSARPR